MHMHEATLEQQVRDYLAILTHLQPLPDGYVYRGPADLVLQTGRAFAPAPLPRRYRRGVPKACFDNAYKLAVRAGLRYCEGYAAGLLPVEHAWCVDADDQVVDPTWTGDRLGAVYLGIVVPLDAVRAQRRRRENATTTVLFDWLNGYPLCRR